MSHPHACEFPPCFAYFIIAKVRRTLWNSIILYGTLNIDRCDFSNFTFFSNAFSQLRFVVNDTSI